MARTTKQKLIAAGIAGVAVAGGGAAIAATQRSSPRQESEAAVNDAAQQLGIAPTKLSGALKKALEDRVDAAVAAGRLTQAEGDAMKQRIEAGSVPLLGFGPGGHFGHGPFDHLSAAASYLGLTQAQLRTHLEGGKTLAQIAKDQGKSVDGVVSALVADAKQHLDAAVSAGRLTQAQEQSMLSDLQQRITDFVDGVRPAFGPHGDADGDGPPPIVPAA